VNPGRIEADLLLRREVDLGRRGRRVSSIFPKEIVEESLDWFKGEITVLLDDA